MSDDTRSPDDDGDEILGVDRRKALLAVVLAVVLAGGAFGLIGQLASYHDLLKAVRRSDKAWFPVAVGGEVLAYAGYILAYRDVASADGGPRFRVWTVARVVGLGFGAFVVGSSAGGLAVDFWALRRAGEQAHDAARRVLALNTLEWGVLAWFATLASAAVLLGRGPGAPLAMTLGWLIVPPACTAAAVLVSSPGRLERLEELGGERERPAARDPRVWALWLWDKAKAGFADAVGGVGLVRHMLLRPLRHLAGLLGFAIYWLGDLVTLYAGVRAFGAHIGVASLVLAYTTAYVVTMLPLPSGGAGSMDAAIAFTLHLVGVALAPALLAAFLYRLFAFWLPIAPALLLLPSLPRLNEDLPEAEPAGR